MQTTDTSTARTQYDHSAIKADLEGGLSVADIAAKHGCSPSLVQRIRRDDGERTPRNVQRAVQLKKKCTQLDKDLALLAKWQQNESKVGADYNGVSTLRAVIEEVKVQLLEAAELYEGLPSAVMKTTRTAGKVEFESGMVVRPKAKYLDTYRALCSSPEHLTVRGKRDTHVLVEDSEGTRFFVMGKELEVRTDA